jgi:hypothetical protein
MSKIVREDNILKLIGVFNNELFSGGKPFDGAGILLILR